MLGPTEMTKVNESYVRNSKRKRERKKQNTTDCEKTESRNTDRRRKCDTYSMRREAGKQAKKSEQPHASRR